MKFLFAITILLLATTANAAGFHTINKPILLDYGASPRLAVVFNHDTHKTVQCRTCHHIKDEQGKRYVKCTREECHSIPGARERDPMSAFMAYHAKGTDRSCYGCHLEIRTSHPTFRGCQPCHMGPITKAKLEKAEK